MRARTKTRRSMATRTRAMVAAMASLPRSCLPCPLTADDRVIQVRERVSLRTPSPVTDFRRE
jgi:hypothetical protein